jgi:hypothetical protein
MPLKCGSCGDISERLAGRETGFHVRRPSPTGRLGRVSLARAYALEAAKCRAALTIRPAPHIRISSPSGKTPIPTFPSTPLPHRERCDSESTPVICGSSSGHRGAIVGVYRKLRRNYCFLAQRSVPRLIRANDRIWVRFGCCRPYRVFLNLPLHCYAYRKMNDLAQFMRTHNPKVSGSNPPPATIHCSHPLLRRRPPAKRSLSSQCLPPGHSNRWSRSSIKARPCDKIVLA